MDPFLLSFVLLQLFPFHECLEGHDRPRGSKSLRSCSVISIRHGLNGMRKNYEEFRFVMDSNTLNPVQSTWIMIETNMTGPNCMSTIYYVRVDLILWAGLFILLRKKGKQVAHPFRSWTPFSYVELDNQQALYLRFGCHPIDSIRLLGDHSNDYDDDAYHKQWSSSHMPIYICAQDMFPFFKTR